MTFGMDSVAFQIMDVEMKMNLYENIFIGRQDLSQQQIEALGVNLGLYVTQNGGEVVRSEYCGFRNLAYPINKNHKGHYYIIQMKAPTKVVEELNRTMRLNEDIIRHLIVKVEAFDDKDNLITQMRTMNDDYMNNIKDRGYRQKASEDVSITESNEQELKEVVM